MFTFRLALSVRLVHNEYLVMFPTGREAMTFFAKGMMLLSEHSGLCGVKQPQKAARLASQILYSHGDHRVPHHH